MSNSQSQNKAIELKLPRKELKGGDYISTGFNLEGTEMTIHRAAPGSLADRLQHIANMFGNTLTLIEAEMELIEAPKSRAEKATLRKLKMAQRWAESGMFRLEEFILERLDGEEGLSEAHFRKDSEGKWVEMIPQ